MVENVDENAKVLAKQSQSHSYTVTHVMRLMSQMIDCTNMILHTALLTVVIIILLSASLSRRTSESALSQRIRMIRSNRNSNRKMMYSILTGGKRTVNS